MHIIGALLVLISSTVLVSSAPGPNECIVFQDDFTAGFDLKTWKHDITLGGGGNWEFEWYTNNRTNSFVQDGVLYLLPTLTQDNIGPSNFALGSQYSLSLWGNDPPSLCTGNMWFGCERTSIAGGNVLNPVQSALIRTVNSVSIKYGRVEVVAKLPKGDWLWPAIWMLPRYQFYGGWPASGEIDIMESRGNINYPGGGVDTIASTLHWGPSASLNRYQQTQQSYKLPIGTFADTFHTFGVEWNSTGITTYVDDVTVLTVPFPAGGFFAMGNFPADINNPWKGASNNAPFDQEFYLIMNVAAGGTTEYWDDTAPGKPWQNSQQNAVNNFWGAKDIWHPTWGSGQDLQAAMAIDSVKIWSIDGQCNV